MPVVAARTGRRDSRLTCWPVLYSTHTREHATYRHTGCTIPVAPLSGPRLCTPFTTFASPRALPRRVLPPLARPCRVAGGSTGFATATWCACGATARTGCSTACGWSGRRRMQGRACRWCSRRGCAARAGSTCRVRSGGVAGWLGGWRRAVAGRAGEGRGSMGRGERSRM